MQFRGGEMLLVVFQYQKTMGKRGKEVVHLCHRGSNEPDGSNAPYYDDVISFTVVNDQGFLLTKHRLYMSSKPFEDPRILPGGPGIAYTVDDGMGNKVSGKLEPRSHWLGLGEWST